jgi:hypothetical protein
VKFFSKKTAEVQAEKDLQVLVLVLLFIYAIHVL